MSDQPNIKLELLSNPLYLSGVREFIAGVAKRLGFVEAGCAQIALAVDEAIANIIRHGYDTRQDGRIWICLSHWGEARSTLGIRIVIEDEARQVDPCTIKGRDLSDIRPGGLGVHIIREVMDEVIYERRSGCKDGMRLTLVKTQRAAKNAVGGVGGLGGMGGMGGAHTTGKGGSHG